MQIIGSPGIDESRLHYSRTSSRSLNDPTAVRIVRLSETGFGGDDDDGETTLSRMKRRQPRLMVTLYGRGKCNTLAMILTRLLGSMARLVWLLMFLFAFFPSRFSADRTRATEHLHIPLWFQVVVSAGSAHHKLVCSLVQILETQITRCGEPLVHAVLLL